MTFDEERTEGPEPQDAAAGARLVAFWEGGMATCELRPGTSVTVGRSQRCDLRIDHPSVSREHAIVHAGPPPTIEDQGSSRGTVLLGRTIEARQPVAIPPGAAIEIGKAIVMIEGARAEVGTSEGANRNDRVGAFVATVAPTDFTVLLLGETGVGKGVVAQAIHRASRRAAHQLLALNCGALPEALLEAELFGHEKGAFTGASVARPGLLEAAAGGTVFLDEVADMPPTTQVKLLRVLEEREVLRIGGRKPTPVDVRFVAATNRDLLAMVEAGSFRADLYYRLRGVTITIPPLRERRDEIAGLARTFLDAAAANLGRPAPQLTPAAVTALEEYAWPGNVRDLRSTIERACLFATSGVIDADDLELGAAPRSTPSPAPPPPSESVGPLSGAVADAERARILAALERTHGNQSRAAELLGISRRTLIRRLDEYDLARPRKPGDT